MIVDLCEGYLIRMKKIQKAARMKAICTGQVVALYCAIVFQNVFIIRKEVSMG